MSFLYKMSRIKSESVKKETNSGNLGEPVDLFFSEYTKIDSGISIYTVLLGDLIQHKVTEKTMRPEHIISNEINAQLWQSALLTSLGDISVQFFPHYRVVQKWINFTLTASSIDIGLLTNFFLRLISFHPVDRAQLQKYYQTILNGKYVKLTFSNGIIYEEDNLFWCLIGALKTCMESDAFLVGYEEEFLDIKKKEMEILELLRSKNCKTVKDYSEFILNCQKFKYLSFDSFSPAEKVQRILIVLNFICDVFESDIAYRKKSSGDVGRNSFLSEMLWRDDEIGSINSRVKDIIELYRQFLRVEDQIQPIHKKLLVLAAEVIRSVDSSYYPVYPFLGKYSNALACELGLTVMINVRENINIIRCLKPHWLRLLVCSKLLSEITEKPCSPELTTVRDILTSLRNSTETKCGSPPRKRKFTRRSLLELPWNINNEKESESCCKLCILNRRDSRNLRSNVADLNKVDNNGWTAIHRAIIKNHEECLKKLLSFRDGSRKVKNIDVNLKGFMDFTPLMCAVVKNNPKMCRMLLEDSGAELLEDVNVHGHTPKDLCQSNEVADILQSFIKADVNLSLSSADAEFVLDLCAQLLESYFITHRTWDVHLCRGSGLSEERKLRYDYSRYEEDININIGELTRLVTELQDLKVLGNYVDIFKQLITVRKII